MTPATQLATGIGLLSILLLTSPGAAAEAGTAAQTGGAAVQIDLLITGARLFDGREPREGRFDVAVVDGRIRALAPSTPHASGPMGVDRTVEADGRWLLPGLIDVHQHLFVQLPKVTDEALARASDGEVAETLRSLLRHGVTTIRSVGDFAPAIYELRTRLDAGALSGPDLLVVGRVLAAPGGHPGVTACSGDPFCTDRLSIGIADEADAIAAVATLAARRVDGIKVVVGNDGLPSIPTPLLATIVRQAHHRGLRVTAHTTSLADARRAVEAGVDSLEHGVLEQPVDDTFIRLLRRKGVTYAPTLFALKMQTAHAETWSENARRNFARLLARGVPMAAGADFPSGGLSVLAEMTAMVEAGATRRQALEAATAGAARHLGMEGEIGTVAPGARADLVLVDGNPLRDLECLRTPTLVIQGGRVVVAKDDEAKKRPA